MKHDSRYKELKAAASRVNGKRDTHKAFFREVAEYLILEMRELGCTDGMLCASAQLPGFECYAAEYLALQEKHEYRDLGERVQAIAKRAGALHIVKRSSFSTGKIELRISCEPLHRAFDSVVWAATKSFREAHSPKPATASHPDYPISVPPFVPYESIRRPWV